MSHDFNRTIQTRADEPIPFLLWEPVEFIVAISLLGVFMALNMWMIGFAVCVVILWLSNEMKKGAKRGAAQHMLWVVGTNIDRSLPVRFPASWVNEFIE